MSKNKKILTLCLVHDDSRLLLGMKKRGFGVGQWNGFGGKVETGETIKIAAQRELKEEAGLEALDMIEKGIIDFSSENDPKVLEMHIFEVVKFSGEPIETEEMKPQWFDLDKLPFEKMWPSDFYWYPLFFANKKFTGKFLFDKPSDNEHSAKIITKELFEVEKL